MMWFSPSLEVVEVMNDILTQNDHLLFQVHENHQHANPESLSKNILLLRRLNNNMQEAIAIYEELQKGMK